VAIRVRSTALGYALQAPTLFGVVTLLLLPMLGVAWLSMHRWDLLDPIRYVGLLPHAECVYALTAGVGP
jgi:multiple sugar transport system permease protein